MTSACGRLRRPHGRGARAAADERDLTEEVAGAELVHLAPAPADVGGALDDDDELASGRRLPSSGRSRRGRLTSSVASATAWSSRFEQSAKSGTAASSSILASFLSIDLILGGYDASMSRQVTRSALIVDAVRSPIGKRNGTLSHIRGDELSAQIVNGLVARNDVDPGADRGSPVGLRDAGRRAGLEHRPQRRPHRGLARLGLRHDRRPAVRVVDADELQCRGCGVVGPARPRHLGRRRDDVARPDGLEPRLDVRPRHRPLRHRDAGDLGRGDREAVEALARGARPVLVRVARARGARP